jgi:hypothetical protein
MQNKLSVQSEDNILSPDGASTQVPNRNTLNWLGYPGNGLIPFPSPSVAAAALSPPTLLGTLTLGAIPLPVSPFSVSLLPLTPGPGDTIALVITAGPNNNASGSPTAISSVKDNFGNPFTAVPLFEQSQLVASVEVSTWLFYITAVAGVTGVTITWTGAQGFDSFTFFDLTPCSFISASSSVAVGTSPGDPVTGPSLTNPAGFFITATSMTPIYSTISVPVGWTGTINNGNSGVAYLAGNGPQQCVFTVSVSGFGDRTWAVAGAIFA